MSARERLAQALFNVWRTDQTGDTWRQLSESERAAWLRVAIVVGTASFELHERSRG